MSASVRSTASAGSAAASAPASGAGAGANAAAPVSDSKAPMSALGRVDTPEFLAFRERTKAGQPRREHPVYRTSSNVYGSKVTVETLQPPAVIRPTKFSEYCARGHMRSKNMSMNTGVFKSKFHKNLDGLI